MAKTIMLQSNLPVEFWAHAVCTAAYTINRLSHKRLPDGITPYEAMHEKRPNIDNIRVFGCHAELLIEKQYRKKELTDPHSESAIFIGYCRQSSGYIFYIPDKHLVVSRRDALFNQSYFPARVGETMLINKDTIKTDYTHPALPDDTGDKALPDATGSHNIDMPLSFGDNNPHKSSPQIENSLKLLDRRLVKCLVK